MACQDVVAIWREQRYNSAQRDSKMAPRRATLDWILEGISLAILVSIFVNLIAHRSELPDRVPRHFGALGNPNAWGGKNGSWMLPVVAVGIYLLLTAASRYQRLINLPVRVVHEGNHDANVRIYQLGGDQYCAGQSAGLGRMFLPLFLAATFAPLIFFTHKLQRYRV
jgi:uncharacterized membrane protein